MDQARNARARDTIDDPTLFASEPLREQLLADGLSPQAVDALSEVARDHPEIPGALRSVFASNGTGDRTSPLGHATWMFISDLLAALVPVLPFALLPMATARYVSIAATTVVLVVLGIGRAKIGHRRLLPTTLQTLAVAAAAGLAGVVVGKLFS